MPKDTAAVIIGRNEGDRLENCLRSVTAELDCLVYVDSGSNDDSVAKARAMGVDVLQLDSQRPFSAARARNEGAQRIRARAPHIEYIQFIDGDCELRSGWISAAHRAFTLRPDVAIVAGRLRERSPRTSVYNRLCDIEWNTPTGETTSCGGIAMVRAVPFFHCNGFTETMISGEEPELCFRLRNAGWKILRLQDDMAIHDAGMHKFSQWWRRCVRSGHGYAEGRHLLGDVSEERFWVHETRSIGLWGAVLPAVTLSATFVSAWAVAACLGLYALLLARIFRSMRKRDFTPADSALYAAFIALSKFPQAMGALQYHVRRIRQRPRHPIEYK